MAGARRQSPRKFLSKMGSLEAILQIRNIKIIANYEIKSCNYSTPVHCVVQLNITDGTRHSQRRSTSWVLLEQLAS